MVARVRGVVLRGATAASETRGSVAVGDTEPPRGEGGMCVVSGGAVGSLTSAGPYMLSNSCRCAPVMMNWLKSTLSLLRCL